MVHRSVRRALAGPLKYTLTEAKLPGHKPRGYQEETLWKLYHLLMQLDGPRRTHIAHATGLGKTLLMSLIAYSCEHLDTLVIEPGKVVLEQNTLDLQTHARGTIAHASSMKDITDDEGNVVASHWKSKHHNLLVATDEILKSRYREIKDTINPAVILADECHWLYTDAAQDALAAFPEAFIIGLSATPDYLTTVAKSGYVPVTLDNGQVLYCPPNRMARTHFGDLLDERTVRWGIQNRFLTPLAWGEIDFKFSLDDVPTKETAAGLDYDPQILQEVMRKNWPFVIDVIRKLYRSNQYDLANRYSVAVCPGADEAVEIALALRKIGIDADYILGTTPNDQRRVMLKHKPQFRASVFVLREGWNDPRAEVCIPLRPMKSRVYYVQFLGRTLRLDVDNPGKVSLVLDPHYHNTRFAPLSAPILFGNPGQEVRRGEVLIAPRGRKVVSPYAPPLDLDRLEPVLTVRPLEIEYWAGPDGTFEADGEVWGTLAALARLFQLSEKTIGDRVKECRNRQARDSAGGFRTFYSLPEARRACFDLFEDLPQAQLDGTFTESGVVWTLINPFVIKSGVSSGSVERRISSCRWRIGRDQAGTRQTFYAEPDLEKACEDLMQDIPQANRKGVFSAGDEQWATANGLSTLLSFAAGTLEPRLACCRQRKGKDWVGTIRTFYSVADMSKQCEALLEDLPVAEKGGMFSADGDLWGTVAPLARKIGVSAGALEARKSSLPSRPGKDRRGVRLLFYPLSKAKAACADLLGDLPRANDEGIFRHQGEIWGSLRGLAGKTGLTRDVIQARREQFRSCEGHDSLGRKGVFYALADVRRVCGNLLKNKKRK